MSAIDEVIKAFQWEREQRISLEARLAKAEAHLESLQNRYEQVTGENVALTARLAEAELVRDSWEREANMNAECCDQLHVALQALKANGIHVEEKWCWCSPTVEKHND